MASISPRPPQAFKRFLTARKASLGAALTRVPLRRWAFTALLLITILMGPNGLLSTLPAVHASPQAAQTSGGRPNRFDPTKDAKSITHSRPGGKSDPNWKPHTIQPLPYHFSPPMQPGSLALLPGKAAQFLGSDGRLEVDVPASAVTAAAVSQAGGQLTLQITQIAQASGSNAGGSGHISLGTYLLQLVDTHGKRVTQGLSRPLTLRLHYSKEESALGLSHVLVVFNTPLPQGVQLAPTPTGKTAPLDVPTTQGATLDLQQQTLAASMAAGASATTVSFNTNAPVATFGHPNPFNVSLNAGALTFNEPLDLPAGPGGLTPPLSLSYSSEAVSEQHNAQGPASWVGEGWSLSLGAVSWSLQNVTSYCSTGANPTCTPTWQEQWELADPFGTSVQLIPPNTSINMDPTQSPVVWQTAPQTHAKVISYNGPNSMGGCFRVFLPNGIMEEFGCTPDSTEYYNVFDPQLQTAVTYTTSSYLDLITDRHGNQIHVTYNQDMVPGTSSVPTYPRDTELATIEYDSPTCQDAQNICAGTAWQPLMRVNFVASHSVARLTGQPTTDPCNTGANLRCDDPLDYTSYNGLAAPLVESTFVLNDLQVQVRSSGSAGWNTLRDYQFSYEQSGPGGTLDPVTHALVSTAGILDLTGFQEVGADGITPGPLRTFGYATLTEHYLDSSQTEPQTVWGTTCGPTYNSSTCYLWDQSAGGNSRYIASASNGQGLQQTFLWDEARNNTHGVIGGGSNNADPLYCNGKEGQGPPCSLVDDQAWSHAILTQQTSTVLRVAQVPVTSTTSYSYALTTPLQAQRCSGCVAGMYWGDLNDQDYLDFYNYHFMGFALAIVTNPDGSVEVHHYLATEGIGLNTNAPWSDLINAAHGHETEVDSYDSDGTTLLHQTQTQYQALCLSGVVSELDTDNPVVPCDIQTTQVADSTYGGTATTATYQASSGFSATQGQNQWRYQDSSNNEQTIYDMGTYDSGNQRWQGPESYCLVGSNWQHPGLTGCHSMRTWVSPGGGSATISANGAISVAASCGGNVNGVNIRVLQNGSQIWPSSGWQNIPNGNSVTFPSLTVSVAPGDQLHFVVSSVGSTNSCDTTTWDPVITYTGQSPIQTTTSYSYDGYGRVVSTATTSNDAGNTSNPTTIITQTAYVWNDAVTASATAATGTYLITFPAFTTTLDGNGTHASCTYTSYDCLTDEVGAQSNFTGAGDVTAVSRYTGLTPTTCGSQASQGFSGVQGQSQWRYQYVLDADGLIQDMSYDSYDERWQGGKAYCLVGPNWQHPDTGGLIGNMGCSSIRAWVAPASGTATLLANGPIAVAAACNGNPNGVQISVLKNGTAIWGGQAIPHGGSYIPPPLTVSVAPGDLIQFEVSRIGMFADCDATTWDPQVDFGAAGTGTVPTVYQTTTPNTVVQASSGFSATQGQNQWSYQYSTDSETTFNPMTYNSATQQWQGSATYCLLWSNGQHPNTGGNGIGPGCDSIRTWTAPSGGEVMITANGPVSVAPACNGNPNGVNIRVLKNGAPFWPAGGQWQTIGHGSLLTFPTLLVNLAAGDQLQFVVSHIGALDDCDDTTWDPQITTLNSWVETTTSTYDSYGNLLTTTDPDANAGDATHTGCTSGGSGTSSSTCHAYDATFQALPVSVTNALQQTVSIGYAQTAGGGFGLWPTTATDANGQTTTTGYDALGRVTNQTLPGETSGLTTTGTTYTDFCAATGTQAPCIEIDQTQRLDASTTVTARTFYDGNGHLVETRSPGPNGQDVVQYRYYDPSGRMVFESNPYYVAAYTGGPGSAAYSLPDSTQSGTSSTYPNLRSTMVQDALSNATTSSLSVVCNAAGTNDGDCYVQTITVDALGHQSATLTDAFGRELYAQGYTGNGPSSYVLYATTKYTYDIQGNLVQILHPDGATITSVLYDAGGHQIRLIDPDRGTERYFYDADGNPSETIDARGSAGTAFAGYDALNRQLWRNTTNSPSGAYVTYTYDGTVPTGVSCSGITPGSTAIGHLTTEQFKSGPNNSFNGTYCDSYDARGQSIGEVDTLAGTTYLPILYTYNDAGMPLKLTYPTAEYALNNYSSQGWLTSITRSARGTTNYLVPSITYNGPAGAAGLPDSYVVGGSGTCSSANSSIICAHFSYDGDLRPTQMTYTHPTSSTPITYYSLGVTYDAVGNITSLSSGVPAVNGQSGGQDNQQFCYDEQDRLTWAGNSGTNPCTGQAVSGTTLPTGSAYTASYQYDTADRMTQSTLTGALGSNPQGAYTYDSQHLHAVDAIGSSSYTAQYDAAGEMTCRTPTGAQVCTSSSQTGAHLSYDVEGRLIQWVSADGATTIKYGYDGEGQRFELQVTSGSTTTTTTYIGDLEEVQAVSGGTTTKIVYFYWGGQQIAEDDNTHWYYPITDHLTSTTVMVDYTGVTAAQLFGPYGQVRWAGGTMPTSYAFTGQRADSATGLNYFNARYQDPAAGIFTSADTTLAGGLNRYAYVGDNPIERVDPSGHEWTQQDEQEAASYQWSQENEQERSSSDGAGPAAPFWNCVLNFDCGGFVDQQLGLSSMAQDVGTLFDPNASGGDKAWAVADLGFTLFMDASLIDGIGEFGRAVGLGAHAAESAEERTAVEGTRQATENAATDVCGGAGGLSFSADTLVATPDGEQAISSLKVGDQVQAYDPTTHQQSTQTVEKIWINHDTDLLDVTLRVMDASTSQTNELAQKQNGATKSLPPMIARAEDPNSTATPANTEKNVAAPPTGIPPDETIHTTANHPWLTADQGWVLAGKLQVGEPVMRLDGTKAMVIAVQLIPGKGTMYDLTLGAVHTFAVGTGQYVVHNTNCRQDAKDLHAELYDMVKDRYRDGKGSYGQFIQTASVAISDMEKDGEQFWVASISTGGEKYPGGRPFAADLKALVEAKGGRFIDPYKWGGDAEDYIGKWAQLNGATPIKIGSGAADMCQTCRGKWRISFPNTSLDVDNP